MAVSDPRSRSAAAAETLFAGPGEMRALFRAHDWSATSLGPVEGWPTALRAIAQLVLAHPFPTIVLWGRDLVQLYNDGYREIMGVKHPAGLGQPTRECWPEVWHINEPLYDRVWRGESVALEDALLPLTRSGTLEDAWFTLSYSPVYDDDGAVAGVFLTIFETTIAERQLRDSEARLRRVLDGMGEGFGLIAPDFTVLEHNREALRIDGRPRDEIVGRSHWTAFPGTEHSELGRLLERAMTERIPVSLEHRYAWENGNARWLEMRAYPTDDGSLAVFWRDVTERHAAQDALRRSEAKYRTLFETMDEGFVTAEMIYDADGRAVDARFLEGNPAATRLTGIADYAGRLLSELVTASDHHWLESYDHVARSGESERLERWFAPHDRWYEFFIGRIATTGDDADAPPRIAVVFRDVTERRRAEDALRASEEQFRRSIEEAPIPVIMHAEDGEVLQISRTWTELTGFTREELPTFDAWLTRAYGEGAEAVREHVHALFDGTMRTMSVDFPVRTRDGELRHWSFSASAPGTLHDGRRFIVGMALDITARLSAEQAAERARRDVAREELRRALSAAEEGERSRLARELHDQLGQELTAFRLGLDEALRLTTTRERADASDTLLAERLQQLRELAERMTAGARYIALELRPPELDDVGFESALATYVREWSTRYGIPAETEVRGLAKRALTPEVASSLYRIAQEALTNIAKHADATEVSIVVDQPDGEVKLIIEDDGRGFDVEATMLRARDDRRFGLAGMQERAALVGGTVIVESTPGAGTTLFVRVPTGEHPPA